MKKILVGVASLVSLFCVSLRAEQLETAVSLQQACVYLNKKDFGKLLCHLNQTQLGRERPEKIFRYLFQDGFHDNVNAFYDYLDSLLEQGDDEANFFYAMHSYYVWGKKIEAVRVLLLLLNHEPYEPARSFMNEIKLSRSDKHAIFVMLQEKHGLHSALSLIEPIYTRRDC